MQFLRMLQFRKMQYTQSICAITQFVTQKVQTQSPYVFRKSQSGKNFNSLSIYAIITIGEVELSQARAAMPRDL